jgi:hypothetical protein
MERREQAAAMHRQEDDKLHAAVLGPSATGMWHLVKGKYGRRRRDYPRWWLLLYYAGKALVVAFCSALGFWIAKKVLP